MSAFKIIPQGFQLIITSWENDGDNYNTETVSGLSLEEVSFLTKFISLFRSRNNRNNNNHIGNYYEPSEKELSHILNVIKQFVEQNPSPAKFIEYFNGLNDDEYALNGPIELASDLSLSRGEFFTRVIEDFQVLYYLEEIKILDLTADFV